MYPWLPHTRHTRKVEFFFSVRGSHEPVLRIPYTFVYCVETSSKNEMILKIYAARGRQHWPNPTINEWTSVALTHSPTLSVDISFVVLSCTCPPPTSSSIFGYKLEQNQGVVLCMSGQFLLWYPLSRCHFPKLPRNLLVRCSSSTRSHSAAIADCNSRTYTCNKDRLSSVYLHRDEKTNMVRISSLPFTDMSFSTVLHRLLENHFLFHLFLILFQPFVTCQWLVLIRLRSRVAGCSWWRLRSDIPVELFVFACWITVFTVRQITRTRAELTTRHSTCRIHFPRLPTTANSHKFIRFSSSYRHSSSFLFYFSVKVLVYRHYGHFKGVGEGKMLKQRSNLQITTVVKSFKIPSSNGISKPKRFESMLK